MNKAKNKITLGYRILHLFTNHPALKIISLILALIFWFYIKGEMAIFQ